MKVLARLTDTQINGACRFIIETVQPDFTTAFAPVKAHAYGGDAAEAVMSLQYRIAGDDFETVSVTLI